MSFFSPRRASALLGASALAAAGLGLVPTPSGAAIVSSAPAKHVLLISIDGMHQSDLQWFVTTYPHSTLASLMHKGTEYTNALTSNPSDSDPGGTAIMTGGNPKSTGIYYDVEYSHSVDEPKLIGGAPSGGAACVAGKTATGGDVIYDSPDDKVIDAAGFPSFDENGTIYPKGIDTNPARIMKLKNDATSFNWGNFPLDPKTCKPISPWDYLTDNSIFQVIHASGMRTAWSDKHAVYMSFNGPGSHGKSIDDFFGPEIDSLAVMPNGKPYLHADGSTDDWAHIDAATKQYDGYKVQAVLNEIKGYDHSGTTKVGTPAVFGMNFQAVSVAQKLPMDEANLIKTSTGYRLSAPQAGGYTAAGTPGPVLSQALAFVNGQLSRFVAQIKASGLANSTTIVITAKHGQSPTNPARIRTLKDGPIIDSINAAWTAKTGDKKNLIVAGTDDDLWQSYLSVHTQAAADFVVKQLMAYTAAPGDASKPSNAAGTPTTILHAGVSKCYAGAAVATFFGQATVTSPKALKPAVGHYPDVFCQVQDGVIYTKPGKKLAEHGGMNAQDRHVLMILSGAGVSAKVERGTVETTQIAPTILELLGLNPARLRAVQVEGTKVLPGA